MFAHYGLWTLVMVIFIVVKDEHLSCEARREQNRQRQVSRSNSNGNRRQEQHARIYDRKERMGGLLDYIASSSPPPPPKEEEEEREGERWEARARGSDKKVRSEKMTEVNDTGSVIVVDACQTKRECEKDGRYLVCFYNDSDHRVHRSECLGGKPLLRALKSGAVLTGRVWLGALVECNCSLVGRLPISNEQTSLPSSNTEELDEKKEDEEEENVEPVSLGASFDLDLSSIAKRYHPPQSFLEDPNEYVSFNFYKSTEKEGREEEENCIADLYFKIRRDDAKGIPEEIAFTMRPPESSGKAGTNGAAYSTTYLPLRIGTCDIAVKSVDKRVGSLKSGEYLGLNSGDIRDLSIDKVHQTFEGGGIGSSARDPKWRGLFHNYTSSSDSFVVLFLTLNLSIGDLMRCKEGPSADAPVTTESVVGLVREYKKSTDVKGNSVYHYGNDASTNYPHLPWTYSGGWRLHAKFEGATEMIRLRNYYFEIYRGKRGLDSTIVELPPSFFAFKKPNDEVNGSKDDATNDVDRSLEVMGYSLEQPQPLCNGYGKVSYSVRTWIASHPRLLDNDVSRYEALKLGTVKVSAPMNEHFDAYEVDGEYNCKFKTDKSAAKSRWWCYQDWMIEGISESTYPPFVAPLKLVWQVQGTDDLYPNPIKTQDPSPFGLKAREIANDEEEVEEENGEGALESETKKRSASPLNEGDTFTVVLNAGFRTDSCSVGSTNLIYANSDIGGRVVLYSDSRYEKEYDSNRGKLSDGSRAYAALKLFIRPEHCKMFIGVIEKIEIRFPTLDAYEDGSVSEGEPISETVYERNVSDNDGEDSTNDYDVRIETDENVLCIPRISWIVRQRAPPGRATSLKVTWSAYYVPKTFVDSITDDDDARNDPNYAADLSSALGIPVKDTEPLHYRPTPLVPKRPPALLVGARDPKHRGEKLDIEASLRKVESIDEVKYAAYKLKSVSQLLDVYAVCKRGSSWVLKFGKCVSPSLEAEGGDDDGGGSYRHVYDRNGVEVVFPGLHGHWDQWWWMWAVFFVIFIVVLALLLWCACYDGWGSTKAGGSKDRQHKKHRHNKQRIKDTAQLYATSTTTTSQPEAIFGMREVMQSQGSSQQQQQQQPLPPPRTMTTALTSSGPTKSVFIPTVYGYTNSRIKGD